MIFSLRQLQEKCREQQRPLFVAFIDLTKAFDSVSSEGLFHILPLIGCPPKLLNFTKTFHVGTRVTVKFSGDSSEAFDINIGVKQGCVLAPTLFNIFFFILLKHAFGSAEEGILLHTRSNGKLFNQARLRAKTKVHRGMIRDLIFADDVALVKHSERELKSLLGRLASACAAFSLAISLTKTKVMHLDSEIAPTLSINDFILDVVPQFTYLGPTISANGSLDAELGKRIGKATTTMTKLSSRV